MDPDDCCIGRRAEALWPKLREAWEEAKRGGAILARPPEPQSDEALAEIDRVILAITVERVTAVTHM
jgi:hypothetical protein